MQPKIAVFRVGKDDDDGIIAVRTDAVSSISIKSGQKPFLNVFGKGISVNHSATEVMDALGWRLPEKTQAEPETTPKALPSVKPETEETEETESTDIVELDSNF